MLDRRLGSAMHSLLAYLLLKAFKFCYEPLPSSHGQQRRIMSPALMSESPTIPPPSGVTPRFHDPSSQKKVLIIVNSISTSLMVMCSVLQLYTRRFIMGRKSFGLEEGKYVNLL